MNPEIDVMAEVVREHVHDDLFMVCNCGRVPVRTHEEHVAEEIVQALTNAGMGVFAFEHLDLIAGGDHWQPET